MPMFVDRINVALNHTSHTRSHNSLLYSSWANNFYIWTVVGLKIGIGTVGVAHCCFNRNQILENFVLNFVLWRSAFPDFLITFPSHLVKNERDHLFCYDFLRFGCDFLNII